MYEALATFDDRAALGALTIPRLAFAGDRDTIEYGPAWGDTIVRIGEPLAAHQATLEAAGWTVRVLARARPHERHAERRRPAAAPRLARGGVARPVASAHGPRRRDPAPDAHDARPAAHDRGRRGRARLRPGAPGPARDARLLGARRDPQPRVPALAPGPRPRAGARAHDHRRRLHPDPASCWVPRPSPPCSRSPSSCRATPRACASSSRPRRTPSRRRPACRRARFRPSTPTRSSPGPVSCCRRSARRSRACSCRS